MKNQEQINADLINDLFENYLVVLRLVNYDLKITSRIVFQYLPFLSLNLIDVINKFDLSELLNEAYPKGKCNFTELLNLNRLLLKQDTDVTKYSQIKNEIINSMNKNYHLLMNDYNKIQKLAIKFLGQKDFSVFSYKGIPYYNNFQHMRFYMFLLDDNKISLEDLREFSANMTSFLQFIVSRFIDVEELNSRLKMSSSIELNKFDMNDYFVYEKKRSDLFINDLNVDQNIFLFNLLCLVNSANCLYPEVLELAGSTLLRMKFITYLIMIKGIWIYQKEFIKLPEKLSELINVSDSLFGN
ncbi:hypothetical protein HZY86_09280 [Aerococcaceae bacterium DSM 111020]|nr:hypothetical protein [Aerococcaceae bacterium DSM 111020]